MSITQQIEDKFGLKIESLNALEKETYLGMVEAVQKAQLSPEKLREYIISMREAVTRELINEPEFNYIFIFRVPNRRQILLKARLQNYVLLEGFLLSPEKAQQNLEAMVSGMLQK